MPQFNNTPGFYPNEIDNSFQPEALQQVGGAFVGLTEFGPAFSPTIVQNWDDFQKRFGGENTDYYMPYAVKGYLKYQSPAAIVRVLGTSIPSLSISGNSESHQVYGIIYKNATSQSLLGEIYSSGTMAFIGTCTSDNFSILYTASNGAVQTASGLSLNPNSTAFAPKILNTRVSSSYTYYLHGVYPWNYIASANIILSGSNTVVRQGLYDEGNLSQFNNARTTWIQSQTIGSAKHNLFKIHSLSDGDNSNNDIKISIQNVQQSANTSSTLFGTFDLLVRDFDDTDEDQIVLESYTKLNFDDSSDNYILKQIGNQYTTWNTTNQRFDKYGEYPQRSKFIRVELNTQEFPDQAVPFGFAAYPLPTTLSGSGGPYVARSLPSISTANINTNKNLYYGIKFTDYISDGLKVSLSHSLGISTQSGYYATYSLDNLGSTSLATPALVGYRKFTVPMYKGWDAINHNNYIDYTSLPTNLQSAFVDAVTICGSPEEVDASDLFVPGVSDTTVTDEIITQIETRKDIFAVIDTAGFNATISTQLTNADAIDSSYAATYYPWVRIYDPISKNSIWVPPSVGAAEAIAFTDANAFPWYAPAGTQRGSLPRINALAKNIYKDDLRDLDAHNVNAIKKVPGEPYPVIWGQKTLQKKVSALESVNVRRLLVAAKKFLNRQAHSILFENSNPDVWNRFVRETEPWFDDVKNKRGLKEFKIVADESLNTPDIIDRNIMKAQIYLVPRRSAEIIAIDFVIDRTSATITFNG